MRSLAFFVLCEIFVYVSGWGFVGHGLVARLAESQLTGTAPDWVNGLLPWYWRGNLSSMSSWADNILYADNNPTGYLNWQWSRPLHYINIPDWSCNYQQSRDCVDEVCVSGAIRNYTKRLETELNEIQRQEALNFLIHFVGDVHQPLHTGFVSDRGGNSIRGHFMNGTRISNLHSMWDTDILSIRMRRDFNSSVDQYYAHIHSLMMRQTPVEKDDQIDTWVNENIRFVCGQIYLDENNATMNMSVNFTLGEIYYRRSIDVIEQRLAQGGRRLGVILNELSKKQPKPPKDKLCTGYIILFALLGAELVIGVLLGAYLCYRCQTRHTTTKPMVLNPLYSK